MMVRKLMYGAGASIFLIIVSVLLYYYTGMDLTTNHDVSRHSGQEVYSNTWMEWNYRRREIVYRLSKSQYKQVRMYLDNEVGKPGNYWGTSALEYLDADTNSVRHKSEEWLLFEVPSDFQYHNADLDPGYYVLSKVNVRYPWL